MFYVLESSVFKEFLQQLSAGSTINHLYQKDLVKFDLFVPPTIEEQEAISEILFDMDSEIHKLEDNPFCVKCYEEGHITLATVVDHIVPHRGDQKLFWDRSNWQPLCEHHHNVKTMTEDRFKEYRF